MRIAFAGLAPGADPLRAGGQQSILRRLANFLRESGHTVDFYVLDSIDTRSLNPDWRIYRFGQFSELLSSLKDGAYDYVQFSRVPLRWYPPLISCLRQVKGVRGYLYLVRVPNPVMRWARRLLFSQVFDHVFVVSPRLQAELVGLRKPVHLLWPPVPSQFFKVGSDRAPVTAEIHITYLGRIAVDKGVGHVVSAFDQLSRQHVGVRAGVYGYLDRSSAADYSLHQELQSQKNISYTLADASRTTVRQLEEDVLAVLGRSDIIVLPYQSLDRVTIDVPLLLLEAMAAGCVVVTTPIGDIATILDDAALISRRSVDLYPKIAGVIASGDLRARGEKLRHRALQLGVDLESVAQSFLMRIQSRSR